MRWLCPRDLSSGGSVSIPLVELRRGQGESEARREPGSVAAMPRGRRSRGWRRWTRRSAEGLGVSRSALTTACLSRGGRGCDGSGRIPSHSSTLGGSSRTTGWRSKPCVTTTTMTRCTPRRRHWKRSERSSSRRPCRAIGSRTLWPIVRRAYFHAPAKRFLFTVAEAGLGVAPEMPRVLVAGTRCTLAGNGFAKGEGFHIGDPSLEPRTEHGAKTQNHPLR